MYIPILSVSRDNGMLKLVVEDTGTGMTEDEQRRVFGAFERLSNAATKHQLRHIGAGVTVYSFLCIHFFQHK